MSHRIVAAAVRLVLLAFVASAVAFALAVRSPGRDDGAWPVTHRNFGARTCATCHRQENNFTINPKFIATLPPSDPLFIAETNPNLADLENPA